MPTTYTVAQALATNASNILVVDSALNIASNVSNLALVFRVSVFSLNGNGAVTAQQAGALAGIGSKFSMAGFRLTERDTVAHIITYGATVSGITVAVQDTAANILAAANTPIIRNASSIALTANATLTLAQLLTLESWSSFTAPGLTLTLADSAANLLALTPSEAKGSLTVFQVNADSTVTAAQAVTLAAMSNFGLASGVTLTIADSVGNIVAATSSLHNLLASSGVAVNFSDTMADLLAQSSFNWSLYPNATITLSVSSTATVSQAAILATLPNFSVAAGQSLTIADTVNHLVTLAGGQAALATTITLSGNDTATAAQLVALAALPHFSAGFILTVDDTLAHLATLTPTQRAFATAETIDDTVSNLLAAQPAAFTDATGIVAELDGTTLDAAQAAALAASAAHATLTLHPNGSDTTLTISDTLQNLLAAAAGIEALQSDGPVTVTATTGANGAILSASAAAALILAGTNPANGTYAVADTGSALSAVASQIFGQGFEAITVTSGSFAGTMAQLLDPTLHFSAGSSAQLSTNATASVAQALALEVLPGFSRADGVTVTVADSVTNILANAAALPAIASSILANDTETVTAAGAATLAALTGFSLNNHNLTLADTAANLVAATPSAIALATTVHLTSDALISEAMALQFVAMGVKFSPNGSFVAIYDTVANLLALTAPETLTVVNSWIGGAVLSTNGTADVADATALSHLVGFNVGTRELTISDSAANLLGASNGVLALAHVVQLSQASTVTAANAATLEALQNFSANGLLTIVDTPTALAAMGASLASPASSVSLATETDSNAPAYAINATQFAAMLALPHFSLAGFTGTVSVTDTAASLTTLAASLNGLSPSVLSHIMTTLSAPATVTVATAEALHALPEFSRGEFSLTISDTAANIATLDPATAELASSIVTTGGPISLSVAAFDSVVGVPGFSDLPGSLTVSDTAAQLLTLVGSSSLTYLSSIVLNAPATLSAANAEQLSTLPSLLLGNNLTIADTAANLLHITGSGSVPDDWAIEQQATSVVLTANALALSAAQAALLAQFGNRFSNGGFTLTVQDTATALLGLNGELNPIAGQITSITLASGGSPISLVQAQQLDLLPSFTTGSTSVVIADTVANLAAAVNGGAIISILAHMPDATFTLTGNDTASVAQTQALYTLGNAFSRGSFTLTIIDGAGHLATLNPGEAALASAIDLQGNTLTSVANFEAIRLLPNYSNNENLLVVSDTAAHLLGLVGSDVSLASEIMLSTSASNLSSLQAEQLATLGNFTTGIAHLTILDSATDLLQVTGEGPLPDDWAGELAASGVTLNGNATLTAAQAAELAVLGSRFHVGENTLTVSDSAANLVSSANAGGLALAGAVTLSGDETALSAANATLLAGLSHFSKGEHVVTVSDTAANLAFAGNAAGVALADHVQLSQASSMTVAAAEALIGMANFQVAAPITITDTLPDLLGLATANLTFNSDLLAATSIALSQNTLATAAQIEALTALPQYTLFSLDGHTLTVADSGENLAALTPDEAAATGSAVMIGDALLTAAQADALAALSINLGGYTLTVSDTATALLDPSNTDGLAIASAIVLSGAATVDAADAARLFDKAAFSTGGQPLTISDTAAMLLALAPPVSHAATTLELSESGDVVTVAQLAQLAGLGSKFSLNDHTLTVSDTLANLLTLNSIETALVSSEVPTDTGTTFLTAAKATALAASSLTVPDGLTIIVQDTAANLAFAGYAAGLTLANGVQLSAPASLTVAAAETLIGLANFQVNEAAPITIDDTFLNLLTLSGADLAHNGSVLAATPIELSANAVVTVAQMQALAALPQYASFSLNDHTITVEDSGRNLASFVPDAIAVPSAYVMIGDATLNAAQAGVLAAEHVTLDGNNLTVSDTPAALLSLSESVTALATDLTLSGSATVTAAQATELEALAADHIFSTGGYALTVTGSASALLGLSTPTQQMAAALVLSESGDTISVANLLQLTELGSKFSLNGNTLTVSDTAAQLATLNNLETALVNATVLDQTATIDATTATELAALPGFVLGDAVTLTVEGTYAELAALPIAITSIATLELTGSAQNLTASQAATLAALPNFSPSDGVVVQDTIANLNAPANAGWPTAATGGYIVTDSVSNLLDNATSPLLAIAISVTLLGDAQVDAADFTTLSDMLNFSRGTASLTVEDGSVAIANVATKIALLATSALVDSSAPVSATQAEALATLNTAHMLSFTGGNFVSEQDSFANITSGANAAGLALATTVTVVDTAAELITATAHSWGAVQPYYELNASADITGAQATTFHALGNHFLPNDNVLTVIDGAANVVSNAAAIEALGIGAQVDDNAADIAVVANALAAMGSTLQSIALTDVTPVLAAAAAGLAPVASKLTGPSIAVSDTALQVAANVGGLEAIESHLTSVAVTDSAANVGEVAITLGALGADTTLTITLTDATADTPVTADVATSLVPVDAYLAPESVNVADTGAAIAAGAAALAQLGAVLGTITLSDGTTTTAAVAAALVPIDGHLGTGVTLTVTDTAAAIAAAADAITELLTDGKISSITAANETVADVLTYAATLGGLGATATISDSAANVSTHLDALEPLAAASLVMTIALTDGGTPDIALTVQQIFLDREVFGLISDPFKYAIVDSSANIAADLTTFVTSHILMLGPQVDSIAVTDESNTLTLNAVALLVPGVDVGLGAALTKLVHGTQLAVTGMTVADFAELDLLAVTPNSYAVVDAAGAIQADLNDNLVTSALLNNLSAITSITTSGTITLDYDTASAPQVNDGAGSAFSKMSGETLVVTGVPVADIASILATGVAPTSITVVDTASQIAADLGSPTPALVEFGADISSITVSPAGAVSLDADHALAVGVDDGPNSVLAKMTGETLAVTGAAVAQLDALHALYHVPDSVAVSDTAANIATDLALGAESLLETYAADGMITAVGANDGPVSLDDMFITPAIADALALLQADSLQVTNVPVAEIPTVSQLAAIHSMTVSDTASNIAADLSLDGSSELALYSNVITGITVTNGPMTLTDAQALVAFPPALALLPAGVLLVAGVAVADIAAIAAIGAPLVGMTVSDSVADIAADLHSAPSEINLNAAKIIGIKVTDTSPVLAAAAAGLAPVEFKLIGPQIAVSDSALEVAANLTSLQMLGPHLSSVTVTDTAANVGANALNLAFLVPGTTLHITLTDATPDTPVSANVAAELSLVAAYLAVASVNVSDTGADLATDATSLAALGPALGTITLSDGTTTDAAVAAALAPIDGHLGSGVTLSVVDTAAAIAAASVPLTTLQTDGRIASITAANETVADVLTYGSVLGVLGARATISDTAANVSAHLDALNTLSTVVTAITLTDGGTPDIALTVQQITTDASVLSLISSPFHYAFVDSSANIAADLGNAGTSKILSHPFQVDTIAVTDESHTLTLSFATLLTPLVDSGPIEVLTKLVNGTQLAVTGMTVADFGSLGLLAVRPDSYAVADTASNIQADLNDNTGASVLLANLSVITSITTSGELILDYATATATSVNNGGGSVFYKMSGESLVVTGVPVAGIASLFTTGVAPVDITVVDTAAHIAADLETASPALVQYIADIGIITVSSGGAVSLDAVHALAAGVDDGLISVFSIMNGTLFVTNATVAQLDALDALYDTPTRVTVNDTAAHIAADLALGAESRLETYAADGLVTTVSVTDGPVTLDDMYLVPAIADALALLPALQVTNVPIGNIADVAARGPLTSMTVSDTASNITADLILGKLSELALNSPVITGVIATGGPITLTEAQLSDVVSQAISLLPSGSVDVTGVTVSDITGTLEVLGSALAFMTINDTAVNVTNDLLLGAESSELELNAAKIGSISVTGGPVGLTDTAAWAVTTALEKLSGGSLTISGAPVAHVGTYGSLTGLLSMTVVDTAAAVQGDLTSDTSVLQTYAGAEKIVSITVNDTPVLLTDSQAEAVLGALSVLGGTGGLAVSNVSIADISIIGALTALTGMTVSDSAANIHQDLIANTASGIYEFRGVITSVLTSDGPVSVGNTELAEIQPAALALLAPGELVVNDVPLAGVAAVAVLAALDHMTVSDIASNLQNDLVLGDSSVLEANHTKISGIATIAGEVTLTDTDASTVIDALRLFTGPDTLVVTGVLVADVAAIGSLAGLDHMTVSDTAVAVQSDLTDGIHSVLEQNAGDISSISFSSGSTVTLLGEEAASVMLALLALPADSLTVTAASEAQVVALGGLDALASMTVSDTALNIQTDLALGGDSPIEENIAKITSISFTGSIELNYTAARDVLPALAKLPDDSPLTVDDVPVANIHDIVVLGPVLSRLSVQDTGAAVTSDLALGADSLIQTYADSISGISLTSGSVTLTDAQAHLVASVLVLLPNGSLTVTGVPVGDDITSFNLLGPVLSGMTVTDTAANIQNDLTSIIFSLIENAIGKITNISVSSGGPIALTDAQANAVLPALTVLQANSVTISAVPVSDIATFAGLSAVSTMAVSDTGNAISSDLAEVAQSGTSVIETNLGKISGITLSAGAVLLTDAQADAAFSALAKLPVFSLNVTGVPLSDVAHLFSLGIVLAAMRVVDTASNVQTDLASGSVITTNAIKIVSITLSDSGPITLTDAQAAQADAVVTVLDKLPVNSLIVTGVPTADIGNIAALTSIYNMTVRDAGATIQADLALGGSSAILQNISTIVSVTATDASLAAGVAAAIENALGPKFADSALVISDTATNIVNAFLGLGGAVLAAAATVELSVDAVGLTAAQATTLAGILHGATLGHTVNVADTAANLLSSANAAGIALATTVGVTDTAANMLALAPALIAMEPKLTSATITDGGPLSASAVSDLLALPNLSAGSLTIADNGSQIAAAIQANGPTGVTFLKAHSVQLSVNSVIGASDAAALEQLGTGGLLKEGFTLNVSDTATHLTDAIDGYLAAVSDTTLIDGVYLKTTGGTVTVTAATAAALTTIPNFHKNPVGGGTNVLIVQDTATHFDTSYATLVTDLMLFNHLYLSTSATVTDAVYGELLGLGVQPVNGGVTVTVRDTAANIASNATAQLSGTPGITPIAWLLSANATVTESQAAVLGGLSGFSAGIFSLTLSANAPGVSVASANALGVLGSAFHLGGFTVDVTGSVAALSGLTTAALAVVTPQISDIFSNIAQMSPTSPLLIGTMTVTDSEAVTVAQATSFFSLVQVGGSGPGIPAANITFTGGAETITDTLAHVQGLIGLSSWTGNAGLRSDFRLEVADSVATLINPANTSLLSAVHGTTLSGDQTATAADLETLFSLENTIHFSPGSYHLTLQDIPANLLNPTYSDAVGLAASLTLPGPETVGAADAESLMATNKLVLTDSTILTISDTSSDLLDGVLGGAITGGSFTSFVHVTLSDNETLDANTAEALVSLPGYTAGSNSLSIVDGVSYLLNPANHLAEVDATSVTLDGDATVSAATAVSLAALPNFALDGNTLFLASNDYADAATLTTLAGLGSGFNLNGNTLSLTQNASVNATQLAEIGDFGSGLQAAGHTLTLTEDALALTPAEYTAVQSDNVVLNGHAMSAIPTGVSVSEVDNDVQIAGAGVPDATVTLYSASGSEIMTTTASPAFTVSALESGSGVNVAATETVNGTESAPIIALEQTILTNAAATDSATFATSGQVQVGTNEYMNVYTAGSQPSNPTNAILVYDPAAHTLSFEAAGHSDIVLLTLGTATHTASLDPSEIFVKHYLPVG